MKAVVACLALSVVGGCAATAPPVSAPVTPTPPTGWEEHEVPAVDIALSLPPGWLALDEADLADPGTREELERDFTGATGLFEAIGSQGSRVRLVFLGVDPAGRGSDTLATAVAVVAVEPRVPVIGLGLGADFVLDALDMALAIETPIKRGRVAVPVGSAIGFGFDHRIPDRDGPGLRARLEGALVTTDTASFLVLRNVAAAGAASATPSLDQVLASLRVLR